MARQLTLLERSSTWRLDERTREIGRQGVASARAQLAAHRPADRDRGREHNGIGPDHSHAA